MCGRRTIYSIRVHVYSTYFKSLAGQANARVTFKWEKNMNEACHADVMMPNCLFIIVVVALLLLYL